MRVRANRTVQFCCVVVATLTLAVTAHGGSFTDPLSWATYDYGRHCGGACSDVDGYDGAVFDGRYVYFVPARDGQNGEVLRYDTTGNFKGASSWAVYNVKAAPVGAQGGYVGAVFDGRYVYFVPYSAPGNVFHAQVLRYDTQYDLQGDEFQNPSAWSTYDAKNNLPNARGGYNGAGFDGRYIYPQVA